MEHAGAIRSQLARILSSPVFLRANRSSQLLRYLVETALEGRQEELKEYKIATEAFGKPESFDPRIDTLVRVEATRLRNRLQLYYESATEADEIEIAIPPGTYAPAFENRVAAKADERSDTPPAAAAVQAPPQRRSLWWWAGAAALMTIAGVAAVRTAGRAPTNPAVRLEIRQRLAIPEEVLLFPSFSPGRNHVYFASNRGGGGFRIWKQTWDRKSEQALTPEDSDAYDLDVSPDGAWIAYWSNRHGGSIYQQRSSGGEELLVASAARSPRFSPDSKFIVYWKEGARGAYGAVFRSGLTPGTHEREPVTVASDFDDAHNPQWTPDGRVLLCGTRKTNVPEMEHDLWVVDPAAVADGGSPVKTGIVALLRERKILLHPRPFAATSFRIHNRTLILSGVHEGFIRTYLLPVSRDWHPAGEPIPVDDGRQSSDNPSVRDSILTFASLQTKLNIWSIPLTESGTSAGPPRPLTQDATEKFFPAVSRDGLLVHFTVSRPGRFEVWRKNLVTGVEAVAYQSNDILAWRVTPDGSQAFFRSLTGDYPQRQAIFRADPASGTATVVCEDCGTPTSVAPKGDFVVYENGSRVTRIAVLDPQTRTKREILSDPHHAVMAARISPDGKWLAFELDKGVAGKQLVVAPFRGMDVIPAKSWIPLTGDGFSFEPAWSPDGARIYFLSDRLASRDLWMQRLEPTAMRPAGAPELVYRFRNPHLTPLTYSERTTRYIGLSVGKGQALLTLSELSASIQVGQLE